jgi:hypothetical protein
MQIIAVLEFASDLCIDAKLILTLRQWWVEYVIYFRTL